jgi:hypothetical protein
MHPLAFAEVAVKSDIAAATHTNVLFIGSFLPLDRGGIQTPQPIKSSDHSP